MLFLLLAVFSKDHILVKVDSFLDLESFGLQVIKKHYFNWFSIEVPKEKDIFTFIDEVKNIKGVVEVEFDYIAKALWIPNDSLYPYQWNLRQFTNLEKAWDIIWGGKEDVIVGILDTGCSYEFYPVPHYERDKVNGTTYKIYPDYYPETFLLGKDFINNDNHANDDNGHGTQISGVIAEATNNNIGCAGIAFNVKIVPIKVLDYNGIGELSKIADGIIWGVDSANVTVMNISLGASNTNMYLYEAIKYAYSKNVILVGASGNDGEEGVYYPARYNEVIAVGAYNYYGKRASYSNYGVGLDVVGPGGEGTNENDWIYQMVFMPYINEETLANLDIFDYYGFVGTSMATPHITALCALMLSMNKDLKNYEVMNIIFQNCIDIDLAGYDKYTGYGIPDFERCVKEAFLANNFNKLSDIIEIDSIISKGTIKIKLNDKYIFPIDIYVYDILGRMVQSIHLTDEATLNFQQSGIYFLYGERRSGIKLIILK